MVLYVALTGRAPFSEETPQQTVLAVLSQEPVRPRAHNPAVPEGLEIAIQRANQANGWWVIPEATVNAVRPPGMNRAVISRPAATERAANQQL